MNEENKNENTKASNTSGIGALTQEQVTKSNAIEIPSISLPKGGGALKGIDEKFEVNSANGTAGFSIPLPISPGRNGFSPSLTLGYSSGGGNSPYGLGWSIGYPIIQRKTDKKLPRYRNTDEDTFMFSGAEDLVPFLEKNTINGSYNIKEETTDDGYTVKRYRPRIEGGFSRIEKISHPLHGTYWKVTSGDNIATLFGRSPIARIADPKEPTHIYQWLPEFSYDDKGNWIQYHYKKDTNIDSNGIPVINDSIPNHVYEKNRKSGLAPFTNMYLKRVTYGYKNAYYADSSMPYDPQLPVDEVYFFELILDYGEHNELNPSPNEDKIWDYREDAFSSFRSGFEIRTNRLCKRVLMFHHFKDEKQFAGTPEEEPFGENYLVRSLQLKYEPSSINGSGLAEANYLKSVIQSGYIRKPDGSYSKKSLPEMEFTYEKLNWNKAIKTISEENIVNAPVGLTNNYQWVDLYGEGISGILTEQGQGWYYKNNLGDIEENGEVAFTVAEKVFSRPSFNGLSNGVLSIHDLESNGEKQIVVNNAGVKGYFELNENSEWKPFTTFEGTVNINLKDPNVRLIDLNGDGQPELVMTEENVFSWHPSNGKKGYLPAEVTLKSINEEEGPTIVFADSSQTVFLADMSGDGMTDIARIRNGEVCYWANMGYGKFSAKVTMDNAPYFDHPDLFNPQYLHLADVSGTGATDIIYLGENTFKAFINLSGNSWSNAHEIEPFLPIDGNSRLSVVDLLGTGTSCIVWSSDLPAYANAPMRYIDLMDSKKPHVLIHHKNNLGKETTIEYKSSTHYYLKDKLSGKPWITKLPFPVQVISKMTVEEKITDVKFSSEYKYHHGYYDHIEREFRGFGMVEQKDSEFYQEWKRNNTSNQLEKEEALYQKPMLSKTWYHTGAYFDKDTILTQYKNEYWDKEYNKIFPADILSITEPSLNDARLSNEIKKLPADEYREAFRACKGMVLRQEVFALDGEENDQLSLQKQAKPYSVATHNCNIKLIQPRSENKYGVFIVTESEAISINYERDETDARISHTFNTKIDELGNILESASVVYGRNQVKATDEFQILGSNITDFSEDVLNDDPVQKAQLLTAFNNNITSAKAAQLKTHIIYSQNSFAKYNSSTDDIDLPGVYRLRLPYETKTYEITGLASANDIFRLEELENILTETTEIGYHEIATTGTQKRLIEHVKSGYLKDDLTPLNFGRFDTLGLPSESYQLAFTPDLIQEIYSKQNGTELEAGRAQVNSIIEAKGNYTNFDGNLWIRSGKTHFKVNETEDFTNVKTRFFSPLSFEDPFGIITSVKYDTETFTAGNRNNDGNYLFVKETIDALDNKLRIDIFNYRTFSPSRMIDLNANPSSVLLDELGLVKAVAVEGNGNYTDTSKTAVNILAPADNISGLKEYTETSESDVIDQLLGTTTTNSTNSDQLRSLGKNLLQEATARTLYKFDNYQNSGQPAVAVTIAREEHFADNPESQVQISFSYSDGAGNVVMVKAQAEPGQANYIENGELKQKDTGTDLRWIGNGRTVLNNKGNPVKQYEPYFSTNFLYENDAQLVETGVTPIIYYDAIGRNIRTELPDGTFIKVEFDSWKQFSFDSNDTILESEWYNNRIIRLIDSELIANGLDPEKEQQTAQKTEVHANTPGGTYLDSLGRPVLSIENNGKDAVLKERLYTTFIELDIEGNAQGVSDSRGNAVMAYKYDMLGHRLYQNSKDAGERWMLNDVAGKPMHTWDSKEQLSGFTYDQYQRPLSKSMINNGNEITFEKVTYGEGITDDVILNLRGTVYQTFDTSGISTSLEYNFKGALLAGEKQILSDYKNIPDWNQNPALENEIYQSTIKYNALGQVVESTSPYTNFANASRFVPKYNEANLLDTLEVFLNGSNTSTNYVENIDYDVKGRRERILYGNQVATNYAYDPKTYRLTHILTTRNTGADILQDLHYTYDPVGNISNIVDDAQQTHFYNNQVVEPHTMYEYDALYRLIKATGREHIGQNIASSPWDTERVGLPHKGDGQAMQRYDENYLYDAVGNILKMIHKAGNGQLQDRWTRTNVYDSINNRLLSTQIGNPTNPDAFSYDIHGNMTAMPHLQQMDWDVLDRLQHIEKGTEQIYYCYDGSGERSRKVIEKQGGEREERIYLGGFEIYRKYQNNTLELERETLHIMDDQQRIAMVETRTQGTDPSPQQLIRYQFSNHLGSASLELDAAGLIISYEEYFPYGSTSYQAVDQGRELPVKRYRYTGMERDEETGLSYHSARYYAPWLARWTATDPIGIGDGVNVYKYVRNNPINLSDISGNQSTTVPVNSQSDLDLIKSLPWNSNSTISFSNGKATITPPVSNEVFMQNAVNNMFNGEPRLPNNPYEPPKFTEAKERGVTRGVTNVAVGGASASIGLWVAISVGSGGTLSIPAGIAMIGGVLAFGTGATQAAVGIGQMATDVDSKQGEKQDEAVQFMTTLGSDPVSLVAGTTALVITNDTKEAERVAMVSGLAAGSFDPKWSGRLLSVSGAPKFRAHNSAHRQFVIDILTNNPNHPLAPLINPQTGMGYRGHWLMADNPVFESGHVISKSGVIHLDAPELLQVELKYFNQLSSHKIETPGGIIVNPGHLVQGVAIEERSVISLIDDPTFPNLTDSTLQNSPLVFGQDPANNFSPKYQLNLSF